MYCLLSQYVGALCVSWLGSKKSFVRVELDASVL
jgi:hypothetical protein